MAHAHAHQAHLLSQTPLVRRRLVVADLAGPRNQIRPTFHHHCGRVTPSAPRPAERPSAAGHRKQRGKLPAGAVVAAQVLGCHRPRGWRPAGAAVAARVLGHHRQRGKPPAALVSLCCIVLQGQAHRMRRQRCSAAACETAPLVGRRKRRDRGPAVVEAAQLQALRCRREQPPDGPEAVAKANSCLRRPDPMGTKTCHCRLSSHRRSERRCRRPVACDCLQRSQRACPLAFEAAVRERSAATPCQYCCYHPALVISSGHLYDV